MGSHYCGRVCSCGNIRFYAVEVRFDALKDATERNYFGRLPTSFNLALEEVDKIRDAAHRILIESEEFKRLLHDLMYGKPRSKEEGSGETVCWEKMGMGIWVTTIGGLAK